MELSSSQEKMQFKLGSKRIKYNLLDHMSHVQGETGKVREQEMKIGVDKQ